MDHPTHRPLPIKAQKTSVGVTLELEVTRDGAQVTFSTH